jgi:predicted translin family RNA/ssDNA-binding protein
MPLSSERFSSSSSPSDSSSRSVVTDEEYLLACMGLTADLYRYGMVQATAIAAPCDVGAVRQASNLVSQLHEYLSTHDFRNGPLRRRYDATSKYALKGLETLLYELTVVAGGGEVPASPTTDHLPDSGDLRGCSAPSGPRSAKRPRSTSKQDKKARDDNEDDDDAAWPLLPSRELRELRERMERRDELREALIKRCRDAQKWAKQSIFALHRGDHNRARKLLHDCRTCIGSSLLPVAREEPPLRTAGPLSGVLEEYAEARLFAVWLYGENSDNDEGSGGAEAVSATNDKDERSVSHPTGTLLRPEQFDDVDLSAEEYLGGLCDLTGEVGRYAVHRGTVRDVKGVQLCHRTVTDIFYAIETMERLPPGIGKKLDSVRIGIEKMERMLYELSLSEAAGGRYVKSDVTSLEGAVPLEGTTEE